MSKDADINLTCCQCGSQFIFTKAEQEFYELKGFAAPRRCKECRSTKQNEIHHPVCSQCKTELEKGAAIYCSACLARAHRELERKTKQSQNAASAAHAKLLASESQKAELAELLRQKEHLMAELEQKVNRLSQDLDKAYQFHTALLPLQPALTAIEERLEALEQDQNKINERMLLIVQRMHEMHEAYQNTSLMEIVKRSLHNYQRQGT